MCKEKNTLNSGLKSFLIAISLFTSVYGFSQESWKPSPVRMLRPTEPNLKGTFVDANAKIKDKDLNARMVVSGASYSGLYSVGFWVKNLYSEIPEKTFWPYMGPDLGKESYNPNMISIILYSKGRTVYEGGFLLSVISSGNYPVDIFPIDDDLCNASCTKKKMDKFIAQLLSGFDYGTASIGRGVFKTPIEIKFEGKGIEKPLKEVIAFVAKPKKK